MSKTETSETKIKRKIKRVKQRKLKENDKHKILREKAREIRGKNKIKKMV